MVSTSNNPSCRKSKGTFACHHGRDSQIFYNVGKEIWIWMCRTLPCFFSDCPTKTKLEQMDFGFLCVVCFKSKTALFICKNKEQLHILMSLTLSQDWNGQALEAHSQLCLLIQFDCSCMKINSIKNANASALAVL